MAQDTMKAILVSEYGGPDVLKLEDAPRPVPGEGEALVRIHYATAIPLDFKIYNGWLRDVFPKTLPYVPGFYASGVVEAVGPGAAGVSPGDRVFGPVNGGYAEYAVAAADRLIRIPESLGFPEAAAILGGADSAWKALFSEGELQAGQTVLIHAAAGGVGQFAVQLAKWRGATVIGTASGANVEFVRSLDSTGGSAGRPLTPDTVFMRAGPSNRPFIYSSRSRPPLRRKSPPLPDLRYPALRYPPLPRPSPHRAAFSRGASAPVPRGAREGLAAIPS
ncbi:NADP-dependent oxidoreductase [Cohnella xylanilytica]|uniref:NADP-dependent oxidoreductase n=1 Tax=Cohnella xylanilytica TaxID=557555 RepID=UPI001BB34CAD|nr:NADP-dependent oxidoreductase [Cohnella xylanilytica]